MTAVSLHAAKCRLPTAPANFALVTQVLSLFFIPLITVHQGRPFRVCSACGWDTRLGGYWTLHCIIRANALQPDSAVEHKHAHLHRCKTLIKKCRESASDLAAVELQQPRCC
jgi:hypothetical protein